MDGINDPQINDLRDAVPQCRAAELVVEDCFYHRLFKAENAEHLLSACCCSQDKIWREVQSIWHV